MDELTGHHVPSGIVELLQRGRDVIPERSSHIGSGADHPAEPGQWGDRKQHIGDLALGRPAASARAVLHRRQAGDEPSATDTASWSSSGSREVGL